MEMVKGNPGWWMIKAAPVGTYYYKHFVGGKESSIFIIREERNYRRSYGYKYEVFHAGAHPAGCALFREGADTLKAAIEKANKLINECLVTP
jgi:hypothetical protein